MATGNITVKLQTGAGKVVAQTVDIQDNCNPGDELQFAHCPTDLNIGDVVIFRTVSLPSGLVLAVNVQRVL